MIPTLVTALAGSEFRVLCAMPACEEQETITLSDATDLENLEDEARAEADYDEEGLCPSCAAQAAAEESADRARYEAKALAEAGGEQF